MMKLSLLYYYPSEKLFNIKILVFTLFNGKKGKLCYTNNNAFTRKEPTVLILDFKI